METQAQQVLNLIDPAKSDIKYHIDQFPDGEKQLVIDSEICRKHPVQLLCRINSADALLLTLQAGDILDRHECEWDLVIAYLMSMRMDRVMSFNRPFSLKLVCSALSNMGYNRAFVLEPHNESAVLRLLDHSYIYHHRYDEILKMITNSSTNKTTLVYSDEGAAVRYGQRLGAGYFKQSPMSKMMYPNLDSVVRMTKKRDEATGKILGFQVDSIENGFNLIKPKQGDTDWTDAIRDNVVFIDDLADGGGTFLGEVAYLKEMLPAERIGDMKFILILTHAVNETGLQRLSEVFDKVYITRSYRDWEDTDKIESVETLFGLLGGNPLPKEAIPV